jgi:anti-anti-sigma factor
MDSSTLGVLVTALKHARERGGDVVLVGVSGSPAKVLELTGLDRVFRVEDSVRLLGGVPGA